MADAYVLVPMDMAQDLRQWAEALSLAEDWSSHGQGAATLRRYKALLDEPHSDPKSVLDAFGYRLVGHGSTGGVRYFEAAEEATHSGSTPGEADDGR